MKPAVLLSALALLLLSCCPPCEKPTLGPFALNQASLNRLGFLQPRTVTFENPDGDTRQLRYFEPVQETEETEYSCEVSRVCPTCCGVYQAEYRYQQLASDDNSVAFEFLVRKDFRNQSPEDSPLSASDFLTMIFNQGVTCAVPRLADIQLQDSVTLNGVVYRNTAMCERPNPNVTTLRAPLRFYFNLQRGIVGYEFADGVVWRLKD